MKLKTITCIIFIQLFVLSGYADKIESYSLPMTSDFSRQYNTALTLEFVSSLDQPVTFKKLFSEDNNNDEFLNVFKILIQAIDNNSIDMVKPFIGKSKIKSRNTPKIMVGWYHKNYSKMKAKFKNIFLMKRIKAKEHEAFIWGARRDDGSLVIAGELFIKRNNRVVWHWMPNHKQSLDVLCKMLRNKKLSKSQQGSYKYSLTLKDSAESKMLKLKFNGKIYDNINLQKTVSSKDRFISFYLNSIKALETSKEKYADFFTEKSGANFLGQIKDYPFMLNILKKKNKNKIISFIMDASPLYIVYYRGKSNTKKHFSQFDYIIETSKGLKFTNYGYRDSIDEMLQNNEDEIKNIIFPEKDKLKPKIK